MGQRTGQRGDRDLETEIEDEMRASGRHHVVPREGLVGAHHQRRESMGKDLDERLGEPPGRGADVAPTGLAEDADGSLMEQRLYEEQQALEAAGTEGQRWRERAGAWLNQHRGTMTFVAGAAVIAAVGFITAARMRD
jgi:hypothetical protein